MKGPNALHVVEGGDHSLLVSKSELKPRGIVQERVDDQIRKSIVDFLAR